MHESEYVVFYSMFRFNGNVWIFIYQIEIALEICLLFTNIRKYCIDCHNFDSTEDMWLFELIFENKRIEF